MINIENAFHYAACPGLSSAPPRHRRTEDRGTGQPGRPRRIRSAGCPTIRRGFLPAALPSASILPVSPAMSATKPSAVSPRLAELIAEFEHRTADLDGTPEDTLAWDRVADARMRALDDLLDHRPANLGEVAVKLEALRPFIPEDEGLVSVDTIIDDIRALAGEDER